MVEERTQTLLSLKSRV